VTDEAPLVSVVIPTYNRSTFVTKAVDSVLHQIFTDYELIVVDDGSTDNTKDTLTKYGDKITYICQTNSGVSAARNAGITRARGKWLAFLDSDDEWKPDYLAEQIRQATKVTRLCMQSANCRFTARNGDSQTYFEINDAIVAFKGMDHLFIERPFSFIVSHGPWQVGSTIFLRDAVTKAGLFDTNIALSEDFDFMARVSLQGPFGMINKELVNIYRRNESTECLINQATTDPLGSRKSFERIYENLKLIQTLNYRERKALNRVISANKRAIGNLLLQAGNKKGARDCYKRALCIDPSIRSIGKYILSCLPRTA
jgi:glycosyltransferase involved in cell wall biosynthesis